MGRLHARLYRISGGRFLPRCGGHCVEMYPQAEHYTRFTHRALPLIALEPERT